MKDTTKITRNGKKITLTVSCHQMQNTLADGDDGNQYIKVGKNGKWKIAYLTAK